ncbi:MAG: glycoside hydrolase family 2 [Phycisphaerales bacterium]|nr:glycoside hydrolase family 2 [Phycisphaerales bacterium]
MTRWAKDVKPNAVLPDYPRPQLTRTDWLNLNGIWEYQPGQDGDASPAGKKLSSQILVPFPVESAISGVMEHHDRIWYRRMFTVPANWAGKQTILHFGAVDYESEVFVNGKSVGVHKGGYDPFSYDVTPFLNGNGPQELIVRVFDPTNNGGQPRGKQSLRPGGIMYTTTTGIWQTVWIEPVATGGIEKLKIVPDVDNGAVKVTVNAYGGATDGDVKITVKDGTSTVAIASGKPGDEISIKVGNPKLWSPDSPFLYDLQVAVSNGGKAVDQVGSYFGMRKVELGDVDGVKKILINGKFTFQIGPLDQGFWPDGIYTQPTEEALKYDLQTTKDLGFNFIRKHIKVEPARWYYWCDKLGLMVWQDMPSANSYDDRPTPPVDKEEYKSELTRMVAALHNVPAIIQWEIFNENQGEHDAAELVDYVRQLDPTRLINQNSGGDQKPVGDIFDIHPYPAPIAPPANAKQALVVGEFGGIGMVVEGHTWKKKDNGSYVMVKSPEDLVDMYSEFTNLLKTFRDEKGLSAAVYTQTTDVETEVNGLLTYDRQPKADIKLIAKANRFEIPPPTYTVVVPTSEKESQTWKYSFDQPGNDWFKTKFDDSSWKEGPGGFGTEGTPGIGKLGTVWNTNNIWMRRTFNPGKLSPQLIAKLPVRVYHDEDVQVYINGVLAYETKGHNGRYENQPMTDAARHAIKPDAENVMAVYCKQTVFGQYIDAGISIRVPGNK